MAIMTKEEHQADIDRRRAVNLARAKAHYADKVYADPRPPAEKLVHRLTTIKAEESPAEPEAPAAPAPAPAPAVEHGSILRNPFARR